MKSLLDASSVADPVLASLWAAAMGPHDVRTYVKFYKWVDTADHSQGFTYLGEIELTAYMEWGQLQTLIEEVESFRSAKFGVIQASSLAQEFIERTQGIAITEVGALLKDVLTENDTDTTYRYKYGGQNVHLWELAVKIGDADRDVWVSPVYSWIYGWTFDPIVDTTPAWDGVSRKEGQVFTITGNSLLHWMGKIDSSWLGDYKNPMGVWGDRSADEDITDDSRYANMGKAGNYPTQPTIRKMLNEAGVNDDNINKLEVPVDVGASNDYSTIDFEDTINLEASAVKQYQLPDPFYWKTILLTNIHYFVWVSYKSATTYFKVTAWDEDTGEIITESVQPNLLITGESCPQTAYPRRWWYPGTGNIFYILMEDTGTSAWYLWTVTLSGTIGNIEDNSTMTEVRINAPTGSYERHWGQCDLDQDNGRLYAAQSYVSLPTSYYDLGYWDTSSGSWTSVYLTSTSDISWKIQAGSILGQIITGFRCIRSTGTNHGICAFVSEYNTSPVTHVLLKVLYFDDTQAAPVLQLYDNSTPLAGVLHDLWMAKPLLAGRGSIGGFYDSSPAPAKYLFQLTSVRWATGVKRGQWLEWNPGTAYAGYALTEVDAIEYRTFNSHGSANMLRSCGFFQFARSAESTSNDYYVNEYEAYFYRDGSTKTSVRDSTDGGWGAGDADEWPILSAPSISAYEGVEQNPERRPFLMWKSYTDSEGTARDRMFLVVFSEHWIQNFSHDYYSNGGSLRDELEDAAFACGLVARIGLWDTTIYERYDGTEDDVVLTITPSSYQWNLVKMKPIPKYERVTIDYGADSLATYPATSKSKNVLAVETNYIINSKRATQRAEELHTLHGKNRIEYTINGQFLTRVEPLDIIKLYAPIPPGEVGYYDGSSQVYRFNQGVLEQGTADEILAMVTRVEVDGPFTTLTAIALGSDPGAGI